jgi:hypothetical protein
MKGQKIIPNGKVPVPNGKIIIESFTTHIHWVCSTNCVKKDN